MGPTGATDASPPLKLSLSRLAARDLSLAQLATVSTRRLLLRRGPRRWLRRRRRNKWPAKLVPLNEQANRGELDEEEEEEEEEH